VFSLLVRLSVFASLLVATNAGENPVGKVIKLLEDLKAEVVADGKKEGKSYGEFACFCKETSTKKSKSIIKGEDKINTLSGAIADDTASKEEKEAEVKERTETHEQLGDELSTTVARCSTQQAEFEAGDADMDKAISSLNKAIKAMGAKKGAMKLAQQSKKLDKEQKKTLALAQLDPSDPAYKYHSKEINELLAKVLKNFKDEKKDGADKWKITSSACAKTKSGLNKKMKDNLDAITRAEGKIEDYKKKIAKDRGDLVNSQDALEEDAAYLKDLTAQCELKAREFDQRAQMRNDEITALSAALKIIKNKVTKGDKANDRSLVQSASKAVSFLQTAPIKAVTNFLARQDLSTDERALQVKVVDLLRVEGTRLASAELSTMAMQINAPDHFAKVKSIIQSLIERLLDEKKAEASKKGFCDEELAKAQGDRDKAQRQAMGMSVELKDLEANKEKLEAELKQLGKDIVEAEKELKKALELRKKDKKENEETLKTAQDGLDALNEAIQILKAFYSGVAQFGRVSLLQGSPVDDDTAGAGFGGAYKGKEKSSRAIFDLLENIATDFKNTISKTESEEADAAAEFVKFDRESQALIAGKETKTKLDKQDLKSTNTDIEKTLDDLKSTMGLQNDALKMITSLKPSCLDAGGMSFKERTTKRDEEIAALNKAICILNPGKKEGDCK